MRIYSAKPSVSAIVFYFLLLIVWIIALLSQGKDFWYAGLAPWYGLGLIFLISGTRYRIDGRQLVVKNPFERKAIPLNSISGSEEIKNPLWKRILTGIPEYSLRVSHNQQHTMLHSDKHEALISMQDSFLQSHA